MRKNNKCVFFDRDGVINEVVFRDGKPCSPRNINEFKIINGVRETFEAIRGLGYKIVIFTNQPDISRGLMTSEELEKMHSIIEEVLNPDIVLYCPHDDLDNCECRKPKPGMLIKAAEEIGVDLNASFVIGDTWKDIEAGKSVGCTTILLNTSYNLEVKSDYRVENLEEALRIIARQDRK